MGKRSFYLKIFAAFIGLAVVPLVILLLYFYTGLRHSESFLRENAAGELNRQTSDILRHNAVSAAERVRAMLVSSVSDAQTLALASPASDTYLRFSSSHTFKDFQTGQMLPLYREIVYADENGAERVRIADGRTAPAEKPDGGSFRKTMSGRYDVYVSRLTGRHVEKGPYSGVYIFGCRVIKNGRPAGALLLSLDQRAVAGLIDGIYPASGKKPYESGNYAFLFDDEGWVTAHPKPSDIRGQDSDGRLVSPAMTENGQQKMREGKIPFNLNYAGFIHKNYPAAARAVAKGLSGVTNVTTMGGVDKMMAYAPIRFSHGEYAESGIFGGAAVNAESGRFHKAARMASDAVGVEFSKYLDRAWIFVSIVLLIVIYVGYRLAVDVVRPIKMLSDGTRRMALGRLDTEVAVAREDEIGELSRSFNTMGKKLLEQREYLESSMMQLEKSQQDLVWEQVFKSTVFENINIGIITVNEYNMVTFMNHTACGIFGMVVYDGEKPLFELTAGYPDIDARMRAMMCKGADGRKKCYADIDQEDGRKNYVLAVSPIIVGSYSGYVVTIEDITERSVMRSQMERMERLASLGRLSAGLAHEIRNPLTGVSILLDDMHDRLLDRPDEQELIRRSLSEIERLETLVNELLSFARVSEPVMCAGCLVEVLDDVLFMMSAQCERQSVRIVRRIDDELPPFPMDSAKLKQAFINLIKNAIEAMPDGGTLTVSAAKGHKSVVVEIADTGTGISEERIPLIFEPFFTSKGDGTGLGLAITHNIISDHKAEIKVSSAPDKGTVFSIIFPAE